VLSGKVVVPSTGRSVLDPVSRLILAADVEGSALRTNLMEGELRRIMYALLGSLPAAASRQPGHAAARPLAGHRGTNPDVRGSDG
jgi:hypothetical protein